MKGGHQVPQSHAGDLPASDPLAGCKMVAGTCVGGYWAWQLNQRYCCPPAAACYCCHSQQGCSWRHDPDFHLQTPFTGRVSTQNDVVSS